MTLLKLELLAIVVGIAGHRRSGLLATSTTMTPARVFNSGRALGRNNFRCPASSRDTKARRSASGLIGHYRSQGQNGLLIVVGIKVGSNSTGSSKVIARHRSEMHP